jgi:folate-binding protein YgfZ
VVDALGLPRGGPDALEVLRIEAGIPRLGTELGEEVFPDEARLDSAISRTKGCYTGQEIVARLYSRGAVNHLLVRLRFEGDRVPAAGSPLHVRDESGDEMADKKTGEVTSACASPTRATIGLGYVRREHARSGTALRCLDPRGALRATVAA